MIELLFTLLIGCIVIGLIYYIVTLLPIPDPFRKVALVIVLAIALIWLLGLLFGYMPRFGRL